MQSKSRQIDFKSATFSESLVGLLSENFSTIEARTNSILFALREVITTISDDIDVQEDGLSQAGVSLGSPGNIGLPSAWKELGDQMKGVSDLEDKLKEELTRVSSTKKEMSAELDENYPHSRKCCLEMGLHVAESSI